MPITYVLKETNCPTDAAIILGKYLEDFYTDFHLNCFLGDFSILSETFS